MSEKCSVIIPVYNAELFIRQAVESVLNQTYSNIEIILIDDCSKDESYSVCCGLAKSSDKIHVLQNEVNRGVSYTRNKGVDSAKGIWIAFLDADDIWEPKKLEKQFELLRQKKGEFSFTACGYMDERGQKANFVFCVDEVLLYKKLLKKNQVTCSSVLTKKALLQKHRMADGKIHEDYLCWLEIMKEIDCAYAINEPLVIYRIAVHSRSSNKGKGIFKTYRLLRMHKVKTFMAVIYTLSYCINGLAKHLKIKKSFKGQ